MAKKSPRAKAADPVALFKVLADLNRYRALMLLSGAKKGILVGDIADTLGMGHSATSHLLAVLHEADIVAFKKEGRTVRYLLHSSAGARSVIRIMRSAA